MKPWRAICAALVIFAAGLVTGLSLARTFAVKNPPAAAPAVNAPVRNDRRKAYLAKLDNELKLTPEQHKKVEELLATSQDRIRKNWRDEYQQTREQINALLTPEQQEIYKKMRAKHNSEHRQNGESPTPR